MIKLLFLHGSGNTSKFWHYQAQHFPGSVALDLPGHVEGEALSTVEDYARWLHGYIQEQGYQEVVLVGHSLGSAIAMVYALDYPKEMRAVVLIGGGARLKVHPTFLSWCEDGINDRETWIQRWEPAYALALPEIKEDLLQERSRVGPSVQLKDFLCCDQFDIMDRISEIRVPTLVICGSEDVMTPPKYARYLVDRIKGASLVIVPGATHVVPVEQPDEVNRAIEGFLRGL